MLNTDLERNNNTIAKEYSHVLDEKQISLAKLKTQMKNNAKNSRDKPGQIYAEAISNASDEVCILLPYVNSCKRSIRSQLQDLGELSETFTHTLEYNPEPFMLYNNEPNRNDRILVFGTAEGLKQFASSGTLYMDGNFAMAPNEFSQLYVICVPFGEKAIILPKTSRSRYEELFQTLMCKLLSPTMKIKWYVLPYLFLDVIYRAKAVVPPHSSHLAQNSRNGISSCLQRQ